MKAASINVVITGTSGTGKTTLIDHLRDRGHETFGEPTRLILSQQLAANGLGLPSRDPSRFLNLMLDYCLRSLDHANATSLGAVFFDRGIPDIVAYADRFNIDRQPFVNAAISHRYSERVFVLPPWREIFVTDDFRGRTFEEYAVFHELITNAYQALGYQLVNVPFAPVEERVNFVLSEALKL